MFFPLNIVNKKGESHLNIRIPLYSQIGHFTERRFLSVICLYGDKQCITNTPNFSQLLKFYA